MVTRQTRTTASVRDVAKSKSARGKRRIRVRMAAWSAHRIVTAFSIGNKLSVNDATKYPFCCIFPGRSPVSPFVSDGRERANLIVVLHFMARDLMGQEHNAISVWSVSVTNPETGRAHPGEKFGCSTRALSRRRAGRYPASDSSGKCPRLVILRHKP